MKEKRKIQKAIIFVKNIILLILGLFFILGAIIMITEDITATIFFVIIAIVCIFFSRDVVIEYFQKMKNKNIERQQNIEETRARNELKMRKMYLNNKFEIEKAEIEYKEKMKKLEKRVDLQDSQVVQPTELKCRITIERIQELYKQQGVDVKVIGIKNNKYDTAYEIIFDLKIPQQKIIKISDEIRQDFDMDGVNIKSIDTKPNRLFITIPLEYKKR